jgi:hypothetical protein
MVHPIVHAQMKPKIIVDPKNATGEVAEMRDSVTSRDQVRKRAYELYESRGREPGQDTQDWLRAEQEVLLQKR